ncbi:hypothetical protein LCGC14_2532140, partial [marine sediment metagenome]
MGIPGREELARRPSAANIRAAREEATRQRFPELSTAELDARERVFSEFTESAKFEPVEAPLVGRARFK